MCGRIFQIHNVAQLMQYARAGRVRNAANFNPTYNMGPTNYIPAIRHADNDSNIWDDFQPELNEQSEQQQHREEPRNTPAQDEANEKKRGLDFMKWGFNTKFSTLILNARVEEMHEKYTFKPFLNDRRCVVIADGYYEWNPKKEPFKFQSKKPLFMAAMYSEQNEVFVLTRDAFGVFAKVHHRMPVLLEEDEIDIWIDPKQSFYEIIDKKILDQQKKIWSQVECEQVAPFVNSMYEKGEKCLMTLKEYKDQQFQKGLGRFFQKKKPDDDQSKSKDSSDEQKLSQTQPLIEKVTKEVG